MPRIVLFGATGYTGDLTARALVARGARPVLAARNASKLEQLAAELGGLETAVADVDRPASVRALVEAGDVLLSTVGPFSRWGGPAAEAAIGAKAHYLDSTGETPFIREIFEQYGPRAEQAGIGMLTAFGYDWVPGNLAGALALREAGDRVSRVEIGYFATATGSGSGSFAMSGGTKASVVEALTSPSFAFRGAKIVTERGAKRIARYETRPGHWKPAISVGSSEHFALPRLAPSLRTVDVHLGWFGSAARPMQVMSALTAPTLKIPGAANAVKALGARFVKGSTGGPDEATRAASGSLIFATAYDSVGNELSSVRLSGVNGYTFTAEILAWGAMTAASGGLQGTGALGPADGFGLDALEAGAREAGIHRD
ncbi:trans-acting enoyl reductase family protein [Paraconexibacter sp.]|uniref:saccharopine dehydrogenase family protein n=1 Tax=Paraconexibacter sp. TaxID=2949640 RepID=UPI00356AB53E